MALLEQTTTCDKPLHMMVHFNDVYVPQPASVNLCTRNILSTEFIINVCYPYLNSLCANMCFIDESNTAVDQ